MRDLQSCSSSNAIGKLGLWSIAHGAEPKKINDGKNLHLGVKVRLMVEVRVSHSNWCRMVSKERPRE